jgi:hypothetical protein
MVPHTPVTMVARDDNQGVVSGLARLLSRDGSTAATAEHGERTRAPLQEHRDGEYADSS